MGFEIKLSTMDSISNQFQNESFKRKAILVTTDEYLSMEYLNYHYWKSRFVDILHRRSAYSTGHGPPPGNVPLHVVELRSRCVFFFFSSQPGNSFSSYWIYRIHQDSVSLKYFPLILPMSATDFPPSWTVFDLNYTHETIVCCVCCLWVLIIVICELSKHPHVITVNSQTE